MRIWTWSALARGAKGICYYAWYPMSTGYESGGFGMIQLDGTITERSRTAGEIARVIDRNQRLFLEARPSRADVAIIYNPLAHFVGGRQRATPYGGPQGEVVGIERDSLLGIHRALFPTNVPLDYVHIDGLSATSLAQYKLVFFPYPLMMPEAAGAELKEYVRNGGTLVGEARLGWNNERGRAAEIIPGMDLHEVMGCRETAIQTGEGGRTALRWTGTEIAGVRPGDVLPARWYEESLEPVGPAARVVARFENGEPAAVLSTNGRGKSLMLGSYVSAAYQSRPDQTVRRFYSALLAWAGVSAPVSVEGAEAEVRILESGPERIVFIFNHQKSPIEPAVSYRTGSSQVRYSATDLIAGRPAPLERGEGVTLIRGRIGSGEVRVLRLTPER